MSELKVENKKVRGFAGLVKNMLAPLNENEKFKEKFQNIDVKILINAVNVNFAALIIIDNGKLTVESIPNKPKENLRKKNTGWSAFIEMDTQIFLAFVMNRISLFGIAKKWVTRKIRLKGIMKLLNLLKLLRLLIKNNK